MTTFLRSFVIKSNSKIKGFPWWLIDTKSMCKVRDTGDMSLTPRSGRSLGGGHGNPFQYSCLVISRTEEPAGLQSIGLQRVGYD